MRAAILAANGPTDLRLDVGSATPATVMHALRKVQALSLIEARALAEQLCGKGLSKTRVEMEILSVALRAAGAIVTTSLSGGV
ncbi:hypothetical protein [Nocardia sp. NPDC050717]|uniref:hypothetical protein n=1 Tax=Nocardia sp. NPDC050717 TaxID=3157221 RepID=UPI0033FD1C69